MITRKADYAIRCVLHLAESEDRNVMLPEIAGEKDIPKSFLAKILQELARAGIVKSARGVKGGYRLAKKPKDINLLEVIEAVQGPVGINICAYDRKVCSLGSACSVHPVWTEIRRDIENKLRKLKFSRLVN